MNQIKWNAEYSVGIAKIDEEHQELFDMIIDLQESLEKGWDQQKIRDVFDLLVEHTIRHFADEEKLMLQFNYPDLAVHTMEHKDLLDEIEYLKKQWERGTLKITQATATYIQKWLTDHVEGPDKKLGMFLQSHGVV